MLGWPAAGRQSDSGTRPESGQIQRELDAAGPASAARLALAPHELAAPGACGIVRCEPVDKVLSSGGP